MNSLNKLLQTSLFWWVVLIVPTLAMIVALYFQYGLDEGPCALCVHVRIYIAALMILGVLGLLLNHAFARLALHWVFVALAIGLALKSWELYGVEKGFIDGSCSIGAGLPAWFDLENWMPTLFASWGLCGITPDVLFGISMAEALMPVSIAAAIIGVLCAMVVSASAVRTFRADGP